MSTETARKQWNLTEKEAKAYKICLFWELFSKKIFPEYKVSQLPKKTDPRKSHLFRIAWKFLKQMEGVFPEEQYALYIRAQLEIFKNINIQTKNHIHIDPNIICGEKSWIRWKIWKRQFDSAERAILQRPDNVPNANVQRVMRSLEETKFFLVKKHDGYPDASVITEAVKSGDFRRMVSLGRVSPYYVLLSPICRRIFSQIKIDDYFPTVDFRVYKPDVNDDIIKFFREKFPEEFQN